MTEDSRVGTGVVFPALRMYAAVMGVGVVCALAIVTVYETTRPIIERKRTEFRRQAVLDVLPHANTSAAFRLNERGQFEETTDVTDRGVVFAGYDRDDKLVGVAIEAQGMGYQDVVRVLYGYSFASQSIVGLRVLESRETPGLGDRIETDTEFLRNFQQLEVRMQPTGSELAHPLEFVKRGKKQAAWQIDGISGATITSRAVAVMLRQSTARWIPQVYEQRKAFQAQR